MAPIAYMLEPLAPLHRGTGRERDLADVEPLPRSDSLASAILSVWRHVSPATSEAEVSDLAADPPFAISSAMPCVAIRGRHEPLLFVPPGVVERCASGDPTQRKRLKKVRFADAAALKSVLEGKLPSAYSIVGEDQKALVSEPGMTAPLWRRRVRQRVQVDRASGRGAEGILFQYGGVWLSPETRLLVLAEFFDSRVRPLFEAALRYLGNEGIGGGRSIGYGRFELKRIDENFMADLGSGARLLLSLMHPLREEIESGLLDPPARYALVARGGVAEINGTGIARRRTVNMLAEGSLVRDLGRARYGQSVLVRDPDARVPHPVYRLGRALSLPVAWRGGHDG